MIGFAIGIFVGFLIGRVVYKQPEKRNKINNALFARDIGR